MKHYLSLCLLLATYWCSAQQPFADGKDIHSRTIFGGKATMLLPDDFSYTQPVVIGESEFSDNASYGDRDKRRNIYISIHKNEVSEAELYEHYNGVKSVYSDKYVVVLRDEFVAVGNNSYYYYECRLKDELYRKPDEPAYEIDDKAMTSVIIPNYFCFYHTLKDGKAVYMSADYQGEMAGLDEFRLLWGQISSSFKLN